MGYRITMHYHDYTTYTTNYEDLQQVKSFCKAIVAGGLGRIKEWEIHEIARKIPIEEILG